jgi:hypothetical protein
MFHNFLLQEKLGPFLAPQPLALAGIAVEEGSAQNCTHGRSTDASSSYYLHLFLGQVPSLHTSQHSVVLIHAFLLFGFWGCDQP